MEWKRKSLRTVQNKYGRTVNVGYKNAREQMRVLINPEYSIKQNTETYFYLMYSKRVCKTDGHVM